MLTSRNYPPSKDLKPFIRRHYVFEADVPSDFVIHDRLMSETAFVRIMRRGRWFGPSSDGSLNEAKKAMVIGANYRPFPVQLMGAFHISGFAIRPSAWRSLFTQHAVDLTDQMFPLDEIWGDIGQQLESAVSQALTDKEIVEAMEEGIRAQIAHVGRKKIDEKVSIFEGIARLESTLKIEEAAHRMTLSIGQTERRVRACYGLTPKAVLRRSRFLELATAMRGMYAPDQQHLAVLRYFDQSHVNREFNHFSGQNPSTFKKAFTPLFDAGLKLRVEGLHQP